MFRVWGHSLGFSFKVLAFKSLGLGFCDSRVNYGGLYIGDPMRPRG